jgi:hypothetical protein
MGKLFANKEKIRTTEFWQLVIIENITNEVTMKGYRRGLCLKILRHQSNSVAQVTKRSIDTHQSKKKLC